MPATLPTVEWLAAESEHPLHSLFSNFDSQSSFSLPGSKAFFPYFRIHLLCVLTND